MLNAPANNAIQPTLIKAGGVSSDNSENRLDNSEYHDSQNFIQHPIGLPISYRCVKCTKTQSTSFGGNVLVGLSFEVAEPLEPGTILDVTVRIYDEDHTFRGQVIWIHHLEQHYQLGLIFNNESDAFHARMIEQACYIETYRRRLSITEGRPVDIECAAQEWIEKYSAQFPKLFPKR